MPPHRLPTDHAQTDWIIPDPGDTGVIPTHASGVCEMVTGGAETRIVGLPRVAGQWLMLVLKTDGGDAVVGFFEDDHTTRQAINYTGRNQATFANAGEYLYLISAHVGTELYWRVFSTLPESEAPTLATI